MNSRKSCGALFLVGALIGAQTGEAAPKSTPKATPKAVKIGPVRVAPKAAPAPVADAKSFYIFLRGKRLEVPVNLAVPLEIRTYLSSNKAKLDQVVEYKVRADVLNPQGEIVIFKDAPARGRVTFRQGAGGLTNRGSKVSFNAETVQAADGRLLPLNFSQELKSRGGGAKTLLFGIGKGKNVKVKPGKKFEALIGVPPIEPAEEKSAPDKAAVANMDR